MEPRTGAGRGEGCYFIEACRGRRYLQRKLTEWSPDYLREDLSREREMLGFRRFSEGGTEMRQEVWFQAVNSESWHHLGWTGERGSQRTVTNTGCARKASRTTLGSWACAAGGGSWLFSEQGGLSLSASGSSSAKWKPVASTVLKLLWEGVLAACRGVSAQEQWLLSW